MFVIYKKRHGAVTAANRASFSFSHSDNVRITQSTTSIDFVNGRIQIQDWTDAITVARVVVVQVAVAVQIEHKAGVGRIRRQCPFISFSV